MDQQYLILIQYMENNHMTTLTKFVNSKWVALKQVEKMRKEYSDKAYCEVELFETKKIRAYTSGLENIK